jgi:hypothetical protein
MFPIAISRAQYESGVRQKLFGIDPKAEVFIHAMQPYLLKEPKSSPLYVLDELTNLGKHRRPILTQMAATSDEVLPIQFPHIEATVPQQNPRTKLFEEVPLKLWIGFQESAADRIEVTIALHGMAMHIGNVVLPLFREFFD